MYKADMTYEVDESNLSRAFPEYMSVPSLLVRFGQWLADKPWGALGCYDLAVEWSDRYFDGAPFHYDKFALFLALPEGSAVGFWLGDCRSTQAPIVLLDVHTEHTVLASSLEEFLARIALGEFPDQFPISELLYQEDGERNVPDLRADLQTFLQKELGVADLRTLVPRFFPASNYLIEWIGKEESQYNETLSAHPSMRAIHEILQPYHSDEVWEGGVTISICWAGEIYKATITSGALGLPLAQAEQIKPHLAVLRDEAAQRKPGLGLWHHASLMVMFGNISLLTHYTDNARSSQFIPEPKEYKADNARMPRDQRRIPLWLREILEH